MLSGNSQREERARQHAPRARLPPAQGTIGARLQSDGSHWATFSGMHASHCCLELLKPRPNGSLRSLTNPVIHAFKSTVIRNKLFVYDDEDMAQQVGLFLAELAVDHFVPPPVYYLTPMNIGWAVDILRRAADECKTREIRRPKLYEALDFLEQVVEPASLVKRYRRELSGDRRNERERNQLREALRVATRGIQHACTPLLVEKINARSPLSFVRTRPRSTTCGGN